MAWPPIVDGRVRRSSPKIASGTRVTHLPVAAGQFLIEEIKAIRVQVVVESTTRFRADPFPARRSVGDGSLLYPLDVLCAHEGRAPELWRRRHFRPASGICRLVALQFRRRSVRLTGSYPGSIVAVAMAVQEKCVALLAGLRSLSISGTRSPGQGQ